MNSMIRNKTLAFLDNKYNLAFLFVLFFGIYMRVKYLFIESVWHDEASYMWQMSELLNPAYLGGRIQEPIALIFMRFYNIFTEPFIAGRLMGLTFGVAGIIFIYLLGSKLRDKFTGLIAALFLTFHHISWFLTEKALIDVPVTTMFILASYFILKLEENKIPSLVKKLPPFLRNNFWPLILGITLIATMLTKKSGILVIISTILYFAFTRKFKWDSKAIITTLIPVSFLLIGTTIYYILFKKFALYTFFLYVFGFRSLSEPLNYIKLLPTILTNYILPLAILGIIFALIYRKKTDILLLTWFWTFLIFFSISIGGSLPRYILPIVPAAFIFAAIALDEIRIYLREIFKIKIHRVIFLLLVVFLCIPMLQQGVLMNEQKAYSYTGFRDAGEWLSANVPNDAIVYAGSPAAIRLFSGFEYINEDYSAEFGSPDGQIYYAIHKDLADFEKSVASRNQDVYLELDMWEYANQGWAYPLSQEKFDYLQTQGFEIAYVVEEEVATEQGLIKTPVIFIFKLEK